MFSRFRILFGDNRRRRTQPSHGTRRRWGVSEMVVETLEARALMTVDILPHAVVTAQVASLDEPLQIMTSVSNTGTSASGDYTVQFHLSLDEMLDGNDRLIGESTRASLANAASDAWTESISLPDNLPQGSFFVIATTVLDPAVSELDQTNNQFVASEPTKFLKGIPRSRCDSLGREGTPLIAGVNCRVMQIDGYPRVYNVYVPNGILDSNERVPMVTMHHGGSGNGGQFLNISGWREKAEANGFISVFPTSVMYCVTAAPCESGRLSGWTTRWNSYLLTDDPNINLAHRPPMMTEDAAWPPDDVRFVAQIFDDVQSLAPIDDTRIYASGFSNGAGFTNRLMFDLSDRIAAIATVGGGLNHAAEEGLAPVETIPMYTVLGGADPKVLGRFGLEPDEEVPLESPEIMALIGSDFYSDRLDALQLQYDPNDVQPDRIEQTEISTLMIWETRELGNDTDSSFRHAVWAGLTHHYPFQPSADKNPHGFVAVDRFWEFFELHSKSTSDPVVGDVNHDGVFDSADMVLVFAAGEYHDALSNNSEFDTGDWNGDGDFDSSDIVYAFANSEYQRR